MIWIITLCLLAVVAWLIINGLNEQRWVRDNQDAATAAADLGLFPSYERLNRSEPPEGRYKVDPSHSRMGKLAASAKVKVDAVSEQIEQKAAQRPSDTRGEAKRQDLNDRGKAMVGPGSMIDRVAEQLSKKTAAIVGKIPSGPSDSLSKVIKNSDDATSPAKGPVGAYIQSVKKRVEDIDSKVDQS